jgi:hypothetical protein
VTSRRFFYALIVMMAAILAALWIWSAVRPTIYSVANWPSSDWHFFSDASPWNAPIKTSDQAAKSTTMISKMVNDGPPGASTAHSRFSWGFPLYFGTSNDPLYTLKVAGDADFSQDIDGARVHLPPGAKPSAGADGVLRLLDQVNGFSYHLQHAVVDDSNKVITAWRSHRLKYDGLGFRFPDGPPTGLEPIRPEELAAGYVNHTMMLSARCLSGHSVAPYDQSLTIGKTCDGDADPGSTRLSIGNVVYLDMTHAEIEVLPIPTWQKAILRGLADHGAVVAFNGGAPWALTFENPLDRTTFGRDDPYAAAGLPSTLDYSDALDTVGGWAANLKVLAPFRRPCTGLCP